MSSPLLCDKSFTIKLITNMKLKKMFTIIAMLLVVFAVGCKKDNPVLQPRVISTSPVRNDTSIALDANLTAKFSTPMNPSSITATSFTLQKGNVSVSGVASYSDSTATFNPAVNLEPLTIYLATVTVEAKDLAGTPLNANYIFSFTSGPVPDLTAPTVTLIDPLNSATGVAINKAVVLTFSEVMTASTVNSTTFTLKQGTTAIAGVVTYTGKIATFTPSANLEYSKVYTGTVTTGVKDKAGNALAANISFSFTTGPAPDTTSPTVLSTDPLDNATLVMRSKAVAITFSEAMDPLTFTASTFSLKQGTTPVAGTVSYLGTTAKFTPSNLLAASTVYTATVTTGVKDLAANALASNKVWSFTTASAPAGLAPVDLGTAGNYVILAKTAINNIPTSAITGDLGLSPAATSYITGFGLTDATGYATSPQVTGKVYAADMVTPTSINLTTAVENMITAYNDAAGRPTPDFLELGTGNLGGMTLTPGLYKFTNTVTMPSDVTISGNATDVWIFQIAGDLTVSNGVNITLIGGALPKNIFFQVAGQATFGTTSHFEGIILSWTGITFKTGASFKGRALAQTAVILDGNAVVKPF
jgi:predicted component of type VI protein secretion system